MRICSFGPNFKPSSQVIASGVGMSTEPDTLPVYSRWRVAKLSRISREIARALTQRCILKIAKIDLSHSYAKFDFSTMFTGDGK